MSESQMSWTLDKCEQVRNFIKSNYPLNEKQWESVADYIAAMSEKATGFSSEVRGMLHDAADETEQELSKMS